MVPDLIQATRCRLSEAGNETRADCHTSSSKVNCFKAAPRMTGPKHRAESVAARATLMGPSQPDPYTGAERAGPMVAGRFTGDPRRKPPAGIPAQKTIFIPALQTKGWAMVGPFTAPPGIHLLDANRAGLIPAKPCAPGGKAPRREVVHSCRLPFSSCVEKPALQAPR